MKKLILFALCACITLGAGAAKKNTGKKKKGKEPVEVVDTLCVDTFSYFFGRANSNGLKGYLAQRMGVSRTEAKELIEGYFSTYTGIRDFIENTKEQAKNSGFIETIFHRRRYIPDINSHNAVVRGYAERNAVNAPIQGSASDIIKIAMVNIFRRFEEENIRSKMILQVHDELNFSVFPDEKAKVEQIVKHEMEHACKLKVPLLADCGWGNNWLEAH